MTHRYATLALAALCGLSACNDFGFEQFQEVTKLRTLAIRIEPPELGPGDVARVDALTVDPREIGDIAYTWEVCIFDSGPDNAYACATDEAGNELGFVISEDPTAELSYDAITAVTGTIEELCALLADADVPAFVELPDCERGFPLTLRMVARVGDGEGDNTEISVKRILLLDEDAAETPNTNPRIDSVLIDEVAVASDELPRVSLDEDVQLRVLVSTDQAETYETTDDESGEQVDEVEQLSLSWFTTRGRIERQTTYFFDDQVSGAELQTNELHLDEGEPAESGDVLTLWFVLRDNRGGTDFVSRRVQIE